MQRADPGWGAQCSVRSLRKSSTAPIGRVVELLVLVVRLLVRIVRVLVRVVQLQVRVVELLVRVVRLL